MLVFGLDFPPKPSTDANHLKLLVKNNLDALLILFVCLASEVFNEIHKAVRIISHNILNSFLTWVAER